MDSSDESYSLAIHDSQQQPFVKRKGYFISKGKLIVVVVALICLIVVVGVLSAAFSWKAGAASRQGILKARHAYESIFFKILLF